MRLIRARIGPLYSQWSIGQVATVFRHTPQRHARWSPTRATLGVISEVGSCARRQANERNNVATSLRLHRRRLTGNSYYLRSGVLIAHLTWDETDDGPEQYNPEADPDPGNQRQLIELERCFASVRQNPGVNDIEIFIKRAAQADNRVLRLAGFIEPDLGFEKRNLPPVAAHVERGMTEFVIVVRSIVHVDKLDVVVSEMSGLPQPQVLDHMQIERAAGKPDEHGHDAQMDKIAAIAPRVPPGKLEGGLRQRHALFCLYRTGALPELPQDRRGDKGGQSERGQRRDMVNAAEAQPGRDGNADEGRHKKGTPQAVERTLAPGDQRSHPSQKQQEQRYRHFDTQIIRRIDGFLLIRQRFHDDREQRAPQDGEAACQQNQVVEQKTRFARNNALKLRFAL